VKDVKSESMATGGCCPTWVWHHSTAGSCSFLPEHDTVAFLCRKPISVCKQSKLPHWQQLSRRGSSFQGRLPQLRNNKQAKGASLHLRKAMKRKFLADYNLCFILAPGYSRLCRCNASHRQTSAGPDISLLRPELQMQWHHAKNQHLGDKRITASSGLRVWWRCDQCPCGHLHEWMTTVNNRHNMDSQCPFCTNNNLCQHNSLLTVAPAVAAYWDTAKNGVTSDQVIAGSHIRRHWVCPSCGHSWQATVERKVRDKTGCPKCMHKSKSWNRQPTLTQSQHPAMLEFDFERNRRAGLDPDKITAGSNKMVHWVCTKCPKGQPHLFVASPRSRIGLDHGCPCCANKRACICNSLQSLYPTLAAEYDIARNGVGPEQVLSHSGKMAFWKDASGHTWEQSPASRTKPDYNRIKRAAVSQRSKLKQQA